MYQGKAILCLAGLMVIKACVASREMFFISVSMGSKGAVFIIESAFLDLFLSALLSLPCSPLSVVVSLLSLLFFVFFFLSFSHCDYFLIIVSFLSFCSSPPSALSHKPSTTFTFLFPGTNPHLFLSTSNLILLLCRVRKQVRRIAVGISVPPLHS